VPDIWDEVIAEYGEEMNRLRFSLSQGLAEDYSHYRQIVGSISGIECARDNLSNILKNRLYREDDD